MTAEGIEGLTEAGVSKDKIVWVVGADLRYAGQQNEVGISFDEDPRGHRDPERIRKVFESAYFAQYGVNPSHVPVEVVSWRLTARGPDNVVHAVPARTGEPAPAKGEREVSLWAAVGKAKLYDRKALAAGQAIQGPALIEERETTVVLPPGWTGVMDSMGCITATRNS
jgi:N-methylhydantoinase A